jgi:hypothetical protein
MMVNRLFDLLTFGTSPTARYLFIVLLSLLSAIIFLLIFKKTSNQQKISYHKDKIFGNVLQIPLYQDRFDVLLVSVFNILKHNLLYIKQTLLPLVVMLIPLLLVTVQVNNRCGYAPLKVDQRFIIQATLDPEELSADILDSTYCETSADIALETLPLRIETEGSVLWRAKVIQEASAPRIRIGVQGREQSIEKIIVTDYERKRFSPETRKWSWWNWVFHNAEGFLPDEALFRTVANEYTRASYPFLFWNVDAIVLYIIFTLIFSFVLKGVFNVTI